MTQLIVGETADRLQPAICRRSRVSGLGQASGSQDAGCARGMLKVLY